MGGCGQWAQHWTTRAGGQPEATEGGPEPAPPAALLATHPDRRLQLGDKLVIDPLRHLGLQLVQAPVTVRESLEAGGKHRQQDGQSSAQPVHSPGLATPAFPRGARGLVNSTALGKGCGCKTSHLQLCSAPPVPRVLTTSQQSPAELRGVPLRVGHTCPAMCIEQLGGLAKTRPPPPCPTSSWGTLLPVWASVLEKLSSFQPPCWAGLGQDMWPPGRAFLPPQRSRTGRNGCPFCRV